MACWTEQLDPYGESPELHSSSPDGEILNPNLYMLLYSGYSIAIVEYFVVIVLCTVSCYTVEDDSTSDSGATGPTK